MTIDENGVLSRAYDPDISGLRTEIAVPDVEPTYITDGEGVWGAVFNETTNSIRVVIV